MNVLPSTKPPKNSPSATGPSYSAIKTEYTTSPSSYGAEPPAILSVNRESRAVALCHLAAKFNCYWNLEIDTLYIEVKRWGADEAMKQLWDMRTRGLLDGFRHLSLDCDIWSSSKPEHCMTSLRLLPNISTCAFIFRARRWHKDVIDPGASWFLLPINGDEQTEYKIHEDWCPIVRSFEKKSKEYIEHDIVKNKKGWQKRPPGPNITIKVIGGREMEPLPFSPSYYEPPGMDFFG